MMKTSQITPEYYPIPNERFYGNNTRLRGYTYAAPSRTGYTTNRSTHGHYNVTERDYGDQKVSYFIPAEYERNYDVSHLDGTPTDDEQERYHTPVLIRRRYYRQYDDHDEYYNEDLPHRPVRRHIPTPPKQPRVIKRVYIRPSPIPPPQTIEYVYENDYRPETEEIVEYVVPRQRYTEQPPARPPVYREDPPPVPVSPRQFVSPRQPMKPIRRDDPPSTRPAKVYHPTPAPSITPAIRESPNRSLPPITNRPKHLTLQEVLAQNRARRGSRIPIPRREVDEEKFYDLPTYNKNYVKNGFIVHK